MCWLNRPNFSPGTREAGNLITAIHDPEERPEMRLVVAAFSAAFGLIYVGEFMPRMVRVFLFGSVQKM